MNKQEEKVIRQLQSLVDNSPPQVRNLKWFWSLQDLMKELNPEGLRTVEEDVTEKPDEDPPKEEDKE